MKRSSACVRLFRFGTDKLSRKQTELYRDDFQDNQLFIGWAKKVIVICKCNGFFVGILTLFSIRLSFSNQSRENTKIKMKI